MRRQPPRPLPPDDDDALVVGRGGGGRNKAGSKAARTTSAPFHEQVLAAAHSVGERGRYGGNKAFLSHVYAAHQAEPANPRLTLGQFKERVVAHRDKLPLARADLAPHMDARDVEASRAGLGAGSKAEWHFVRVKPK